MQAYDDTFANTVAGSTMKEPYQVTINASSTVRFLLVHEPHPDPFAIATRIHNCRECGQRYAFFHNLSGLGGEPIFDFNCSDEHATEYEHLNELARKTCSTKPINILVIKPTDSHLRFKQCAGKSPNGDLFNHYYFGIPDSMRSDVGTSHQLFNAAVHRYLTAETDPIISRLVGKVLAQGDDSIDLLADALSKVAYGNTYNAAIEWMRLVLKRHKDIDKKVAHFGFLFNIEAISFASLNRDAVGAVCPTLHSALHLIDLLDEVESINELENVLTTRLDPRNYRRKTTEATVGQLTHAAKVLGTFRTRVMTMEDASLQKGWYAIGSKITDTSAGAVFSDIAARRSKARTFAERVGDDAMKEKISKITSFAALKSFLQDYPNANVTLGDCRFRPVYHLMTVDVQGVTTKFDYIRDDIDYMWGFGGITVHRTGKKVVGILHTKTGRFNNFVLCVEGVDSSAINIDSGCFFPEFLSTAYSATCGKAFEELCKNHRSIIEVPKGVQLAIGHGTSVKNSQGDLMDSIPLHIMVGALSGSCTLIKSD